MLLVQKKIVKEISGSFLFCSWKYFQALLERGKVYTKKKIESRLLYLAFILLSCNSREIPVV